MLCRVSTSVTAAVVLVFAHHVVSELTMASISSEIDHLPRPLFRFVGAYIISVHQFSTSSLLLDLSVLWNEPSDDTTVPLVLQSLDRPEFMNHLVAPVGSTLGQQNG